MDWQAVKPIIEDAAQLAPVGTAIIATIAAIIAFFALRTQRDIARKRAALDFFLKTEADSYTFLAWKEFEAAREALLVCADLASFQNTEHWMALRRYLNLHELIAVGINQRVLDNDVCFEFWSGELRRAYRDCKLVIEHIQSNKDEQDTYAEIVNLHNKWHGR
jgi:hypothetical protein